LSFSQDGVLGIERDSDLRLSILRLSFENGKYSYRHVNGWLSWHIALE